MSESAKNYRSLPRNMKPGGLNSLTIFRKRSEERNARRSARNKSLDRQTLLRKSVERQLKRQKEQEKEIQEQKAERLKGRSSESN